jgi:glycosyltransferase involved in cell wall biosynthesis
MTKERRNPLEPASPPGASLLLSVVIPALAPDLELRRCVDSVRLACPAPERCEVVLVVPASRAEEAREAFPSERIVAETRRGIYSAMNDGIASSTGTYLYFLGKDDIVLPPFGDMLDALEAERPSALFFDVYWGRDGVYQGWPSRWRILVRNLCHQGIVYSRAALIRHGPYLRKMRVQADHLLNIRLLWDPVMRAKVHYVRAAAVWYSGAGFSVQMSRDPVFWRLYPVAMRRYVGTWASLLLVASRKLRAPRR